MITKLLAPVAALLLSATVASATKSYTRHYSNGGPCGWDKIVENTNIDGNHDIVCDNPGYEACWWTIDPPKAFVHDDVFPYVDAEIADGNASGTTSLDGGIEVTWSVSEDGVTNVTVTCPE